MAKKAKFLFEYNNYSIPIELVKEWRRTVRVSLARKGAYLRVPQVMPSILIEKEIAKAKDWIKKTIAKNPPAFVRFRNEAYPDHFEKKVYGETFYIHVERSERKTNSGKIKGQNLYLTLSDQLTAFQEKDVIKKLQSRLFGQYFLPKITERVRRINDASYQKNFETVRLKYNQSNWGSCSSASNLNFSTRLLLTPTQVIDYVIVHELAHLTEMNHSKRFWDLVEKVMPSYKEKEDWLDQHGAACDF